MAEIDYLGQDEDGCHGEQGPGVLEQALGRVLKEEDGDIVAEGKKEIEEHPVGEHADAVDLRQS